MKNFAFSIAIIILLFFLGFRECQHRRDMKAKPLNDTITITRVIPGDSIPYPVIIPTRTPVYVYRDTGSTLWRNRPIDTMAILKDYYSKYTYDDTLMNDTSAFIRLQSHTTENKLHYDNLFFQNKREKKIITTITPPTPERIKWFVGMGVNAIPGKQFLSGNLMIESPSGFAISGAYDFLGENVIVTGYYKIRLRKR
jgi:hypothetical protein